MGLRILEKLRNTNKGTVLGLTGFGLVAAIGLTIPLWLLSLTQARQTDSSIECRHQQDTTKTLVGTLRRAGSSFYIQEKTWHFIAPACSGKPSIQCPLNAHAKLLDSNVGQTISAGLCEKEIVSYTVQGITFSK